VHNAGASAASAPLDRRMDRFPRGRSCVVHAARRPSRPEVPGEPAG
jgi:hypothetical protein